MLLFVFGLVPRRDKFWLLSPDRAFAVGATRQVFLVVYRSEDYVRADAGEEQNGSGGEGERVGV